MSLTVELSAEDSKHPNAALVAFWAADLLFRMYNDITIEIGESIASPFDSGRSLSSNIAAARSNIPPPKATFSGEGRLRISPLPHPSYTNIWADGWTVWINTGAEQWREWNPLSAAAAACLGAAFITPSIGGDARRALVWSLRSRMASQERGAVDQHLVVPPTFIAGVGAVGSSFVQVLRSFSLTGDFQLADNQKISTTNLRRYVGTYTHDIGMPKADRAAELLKGRGARAHGALQPAQERLSDLPPDGVLIAAVDTAPGRRALAENLPPVVLDAAVSDEEPRVEVIRSSFPPDGPCLTCFYPPTAAEKTRDEEIATAFELTTEEVVALRARGTALSDSQLRKVEQSTGRPVAPEMVKENIDTLYTRHYCGGPLKQKNFSTRESVAERSVVSENEVDLTPVPTFAGILLAVEYVLLCNGYVRPQNYFTWNLGLQPNPHMSRVRRAIPNCNLCSDPDFMTIFSKRYR